MTITAAFCPLSLQALLDLNGVPIAGGRIVAFNAGTTTARSVFQDKALTVPHPSPVLTDAYGRIPVMWIGPGAYKLVIQDERGAQQSVVDNLPGGTDDGGQAALVGTVIPVGFVMGAHTDETFDGWLPLNAKTIGSSASSATARANDDAKNLFIKLWNKDTTRAVLGGRGVSATADWNAAKTIALPDYRGRAPVGADGMGSGLAGILTAATTTTPDKIGTPFGGERAGLAVDQLPAHGHTVTVNAAGGHGHTGAVASSTHSHTGTTESVGDHTHTYNDPASGVSAFGLVNQGGPYANPTQVHNSGPAGSHNHTVTLGGGDHAHGLTINAVGDHVHTASATQTGSGNNHANVQPSIVCFWHIKL